MSINIGNKPYSDEKDNKVENILESTHQLNKRVNEYVMKNGLDTESLKDARYLAESIIILLNTLIKE